LAAFKLEGGECEVGVLGDELFVLVVERDLDVVEFSVEDSGGEEHFVEFEIVRGRVEFHVFKSEVDSGRN
jgi:hypothetical protein